ncbi:MAG: hypothetical protein COA78_32850, partial [Blastopirellula sp.]
NLPTQAEIDALDAASQRWLVQEHIDADRPIEAILAFRMGPDYFAEQDRKIFWAFVCGMAWQAALKN